MDTQEYEDTILGVLKGRMKEQWNEDFIRKKEVPADARNIEYLTKQRVIDLLRPRQFGEERIPKMGVYEEAGKEYIFFSMQNKICFVKKEREGEEDKYTLVEKDYNRDLPIYPKPEDNEEQE